MPSKGRLRAKHDSMAVFDRNKDGTTDSLEVGRTIAEGGLWVDSLGGGWNSSGGKGGTEPGCSCGGCLMVVAVLAGILIAIAFFSQA